MRVAFRADASLRIGTGHVMRCLTLADALRRAGAHCCFITRAHEGNLIDFIRSRGYDTVVLPLAQDASAAAAGSAGEPLVSHADWLGESWQRDAGQTRGALSRAVFDWLVVDHYALDARWERALRGACGGIFVIDDLADRAHDCEVLLDQNLGREAADYASHVDAGCDVLAGPRYVLLREEFAAMRSRSLDRRREPRLRRLLITMGGVDQPNATGAVLDALRDCELPADLSISVVMGLHAPWREQVRAQAATMPWTTEVLVGVKDMATLMADCDLAIGAAGSTSWERCALGLPTFLAVLADNQKSAAQALSLAGAVAVLELDEALPPVLKNLFRDLHRNPSALAGMACSAAAICDGEGVARVLPKLLRERVASPLEE
ncbi:UDP-2,4-diacetamido-2,4,6-trideoxy-beta-L-altropyranose hydrolase [Bordetella genomosp. 13]|uniref:UDP-2,4-diacetamido-2,4, 6-trideoxy-beta-L-altropyranose hydrolase n=1 Tax=Bordetella genomosp. 13 TaxID=463040 RepID=UPI00119E8147|nr:UDP-2,4-diacetamido-2,4,6-trideoxy-beta-L-altropyranose hydrolase [Bordetella genomosp. 13]